jgi:ketosteroid isomerase-like protein
MLSKTNHHTTLVNVFEAFNHHDADGVAAYMTENSIFDTIGGSDAYGTRIQGRDAIRNAFAAVWAGMPDARWDVIRHTIADDRAFSEWVFSGTDAQGMRIEAEGVDLFTFDGPLIASKRAFRKQRPSFKG